MEKITINDSNRSELKAFVLQQWRNAQQQFMAEEAELVGWLVEAVDANENPALEDERIKRAAASRQAMANSTAKVAYWQARLDAFGEDKKPAAATAAKASHG